MGVRFIKSAKEAKGFPTCCSKEGAPLKEVAVLGRSNVGKSSLLNHLFGVKSLVKTSQTPGKTRLLNFFCLDEQLFFVDFPGYGYAKVPDKALRSFEKMAEQYFTERSSLFCVLFLFDIRRDPKEEDLALVEWLKGTGHTILGVLTKADKLGSTKRLGRKKEVERLFSIPFFLTSTLKNLGRKELLGAIYEAAKR